MNVLDHEPQLWFLLEEDGQLLLDANCNHSIIGYTFLIKLQPHEEAEYKNRGRAYLNWLAQDIQVSAPILKVSNSPYKGRDLTSSHSEQVSTAVKNWRTQSLSNSLDKLHKYTDACASGVYTPNELVGAIIQLLVDTPDFSKLWTEIPAWIQLKIWSFLKACDETTVLYNTYSRRSEVISPRLIGLKRWLIAEMSYN